MHAPPPFPSRGGIAFARPSPAPSPRRSPLRRNKASASGQIARLGVHDCIYRSILTVELRLNEFCPLETCLPWWVVLLAPELLLGPAGAQEPPPHRPREPSQGAARREALQPSVPGEHTAVSKSANAFCLRSTRALDTGANKFERKSSYGPNSP